MENFFQKMNLKGKIKKFSNTVKSISKTRLHELRKQNHHRIEYYLPNNNNMRIAARPVFTIANLQPVTGCIVSRCVTRKRLKYS